MSDPSARAGAATSGEASGTAAELIDLVRSRKGSVMAPKAVEFTDAIPLTPLGNGRWSGSLAVKPGRYEYLFVVDGTWTPDPNARESSSELAQKIRRAEIPIPQELLNAVQANPPAGEFFRSLAASKQRLYMGWVMSASKAETRN